MASESGTRGNTTVRPVAFTAKLRMDDSFPSNSGVLKFGTVQVNQGGGYDGDTGIFTCPVNGLYHFFVHMAVYQRGQCAIFKNGEKVVVARHTNLPDTLSYKCSQVASMSSVVKLSENDEVWVNVDGQGPQEIIATEDNDTIFAGYYVR
ncbi:complement C1q and tumor necrosis factor-related protein 9B-like [Genypterus blacodes]|uniref:complement C1q and tumor necrosis factor-related protein 9B-like n=1 Tax=Genypterus blacodes TaxID=154954 RepID=UPI003F762DAF